MDLFINTNTLELVDSKWSRNKRAAISFKRGQSRKLFFHFVKNGVAQELESGASGSFSIKSVNEFESQPVLLVSSWTKQGTGSSAYYEMSADFSNAAIDTLLADDTPAVSLMGELRWVEDGAVSKTMTFLCVIENDVHHSSDSSPEFTGVESGSINLVESQSYVDVIFQNVRADAEFSVFSMAVENNVDETPINITAGLVTNKTTAGFRVNLNASPDSGNYVLNWSVSS